MSVFTLVFQNNRYIEEIIKSIQQQDKSQPCLLGPAQFSLRCSADGKHLMRFQSETSVFKFLRRRVDGKHLMRFRSEISILILDGASEIQYCY